MHSVRKSYVSKLAVGKVTFAFVTRVTMVVGMKAIWNETADSVKNLMKDHNMIVANVKYFKEPYHFNQEMYNIAETTHPDSRSKITFSKDAFN